MPSPAELKKANDDLKPVKEMAEKIQAIPRRYFPGKAGEWKHYDVTKMFDYKGSPLEAAAAELGQFCAQKMTGSTVIFSPTQQQNVNKAIKELQEALQELNKALLDGSITAEKYHQTFDVLKQKVAGILPPAGAAPTPQHQALNEMLAKVEEVRKKLDEQAKAVLKTLTDKQQEILTTALSRAAGFETKGRFPFKHRINPLKDEEFKPEGVMAGAYIQPFEYLVDLEDGEYLEEGKSYSFQKEGSKVHLPSLAGRSDEEVRAIFADAIKFIPRMGSDTMVINYPTDPRTGAIDPGSINFEHIKIMMEEAAKRKPPVAVELGAELKATFIKIRGMKPDDTIRNSSFTRSIKVSEAIKYIREIEKTASKMAAEKKSQHDDPAVDIARSRSLDETTKALQAADRQLARDWVPPPPPTAPPPGVAPLSREAAFGKTLHTGTSSPMNLADANKTIANVRKELKACSARLELLAAEAKQYEEQQKGIVSNIKELQAKPDKLEGALEGHAIALEKEHALLAAEQKDITDRIFGMLEVAHMIEIAGSSPALTAPAAEAKAVRLEIDAAKSKAEACKAVMNNHPIDDAKIDKVTEARNAAKRAVAPRR